MVPARLVPRPLVYNLKIHMVVVVVADPGGLFHPRQSLELLAVLRLKNFVMQGWLEDDFLDLEPMLFGCLVQSM